MKEQIKQLLEKGNDKIKVDYVCKTTRTNSDYIEISLGGNLVKTINDSDPKGFEEELKGVVSSLNSEYPNLHVNMKKVEFHFYYPGFNSSHTSICPVEISNIDKSKEVEKTGRVTEKYELVGSGKIKELIKKYPDYELYLRCGFGYRGSKDNPTTIERLEEVFDWMCCADVEVIDNEIHVNAFSFSDME